jgi:hypothetical protein
MKRNGRPSAMNARQLAACQKLISSVRFAMRIIPTVVITNPIATSFLASNFGASLPATGKRNISTRAPVDTHMPACRAL